MRKYRPHAIYQAAREKIASQRGRAYGTIILSFLTASFFAVFAIRPTVLTIVELRRQVADLEEVNAKLLEKKDTLSRLSFVYRSLEPDLAIIDAAVPTRSKLSGLTGVLNNAAASGVSLSGLSLDGLTITSSDIQASSQQLINPQLETIHFKASYTGPYNQLLETADLLKSPDRLVVIDSFSLTPEKKSGELLLSIEGRTFNIVVR